MRTVTDGYELDEPRFRDRFMLWSWDWRHWYPHFWQGGDEYGNPSVCFSWFISVIFFYNPSFQQEVEMPEPGENFWVDVMFYYGRDKKIRHVLDYYKLYHTNLKPASKDDGPWGSTWGTS